MIWDIPSHADKNRFELPRVLREKNLANTHYYFESYRVDQTEYLSNSPLCPNYLQFEKFNLSFEIEYKREIKDIVNQRMLPFSIGLNG